MKLARIAEMNPCSVWKNEATEFTPWLAEDENLKLYLSTALMYMNKIFSFNNMGTLPIIKKMSMMLPVTSTDEIDYEFMETYISAVKKQVIGRLKEFIGREKSAYMQVIGKQ